MQNYEVITDDKMSDILDSIEEETNIMYAEGLISENELENTIIMCNERIITTNDFKKYF